MKNDSQYVPGICNINYDEIKSRRNAGHFGLGLTIVVVAFLVYLRAMPLLSILVFVPGFIMAIGYLQAKNKFCVGFGAAGIHSASESGADTAAVEDEAAQKADKEKSRRMNLQSAGVGIALSVITALLLAIL